MTNADRGQVLASAAEVYEEFFVPALFGQWPDQVLEAAAVAEGHRVLDVGCGTGVLARAAVHRLRGTGQVVGLDPNDGMLSVARRASATVEWRTGVAEALPFDDATFDRVVSQFALMFFTDRQAALAEMARVLAPGGRLAVATWASLDDTPGYAAMVDLLRDVCGDDAAAALTAPFAVGDPVELRDLVSRALPDVVVTRHDGVARFASIDAWLHTDIRGWTLADMIDDEQYATLLAHAHEALARFTDGRGRVRLPAPALIAAATSGTGVPT